MVVLCGGWVCLCVFVFVVLWFVGVCVAECRKVTVWCGVGVLCGGLCVEGRGTSCRRTLFWQGCNLTGDGLDAGMADSLQAYVVREHRSDA